MTDKSKQLKIAIIVPYRDIHPAQKRASHLKQFIPYMESFMENAIDKFNKTAKFHIFIIEQSPDHKFNRGELLNIGFDIARKQGYNVFIFHDVDLLPGETISRYYVKDPEIKKGAGAIIKKSTRKKKQDVTIDLDANITVDFD